MHGLLLVLMEMKVSLNCTRFYEADGPSVRMARLIVPRETNFFVSLCRSVYKVYKIVM